MDYILKAENLTKIYGHHKALDNFSMHIPQGAIYGLVSLLESEWSDKT
ncbi:MAG: hypothetical protein E7B61_14470 [Clostridiales bacterium]|nr:hypothetical protein [Clostridiales bacterium]